MTKKCTYLCQHKQDGLKDITDIKTPMMLFFFLSASVSVCTASLWTVQTACTHTHTLKRTCSHTYRPLKGPFSTFNHMVQKDLRKQFSKNNTQSTHRKLLNSSPHNFSLPHSDTPQPPPSHTHTRQL